LVVAFPDEMELECARGDMSGGIGIGVVADCGDLGVNSVPAVGTEFFIIGGEAR
jgi:hypothetical protein